jgi:NTE family protein
VSPSGRNGIVLSGGGARGAYEVGVLKYIRNRLPKILGRHLDLPIISGTSVGALNASFLAGTADDLDHQADRLVAAWTSLHIEDLISLKTGDLLRAGRLLMGADPPPPKPGSYRYGGLLNTTGLEQFVFKVVPWRRIRSNLKRRTVEALAVVATHVGSGHTVIFLDTAKPIPGAWSHNPFVRHTRAAIGPRHALASAAIPMLFPAVKVGRAFYVDGGLRNNTPMSPAIRLGADRLLVVSLRHLSTQKEEADRAHDRESAYPKPLFLAGKALNSLLLDPTEYDLERMERINAILDAGTRAFGDSFIEVIGKEMNKLRGAPLRRLRAVHIQPSEDIGKIAADFLSSGGPTIKSRVTRRLLQRLAHHEARYEADLLSYLLFDGGFARELIELGYRDAEAKEDEIVNVFAGSS